MVLMKMKVAILFLLATCLKSSSSATCHPSNISEFIIGYTGSAELEYLAAVAMFDIDFRKHHEPALQLRHGPPVLQMPNLNPCLRIRPVILSHGTGSDPKIEPKREQFSVENMHRFTKGDKGCPKAVGIFNCGCNECQTKMATYSTTFGMPLIGMDTISVMSDKIKYKYSFRQAAPDTVQGEIFFWYFHALGFKTAAFIYSTAVKGQDVFTRCMAMAAKNNMVDRIFPLAFPFVGSEPAPDIARDLVGKLKNMPTRLLIMQDPFQMDTVVEVLEEFGIWMPQWQFCFGSSFASAKIIASPRIMELLKMPIHIVYGVPRPDAIFFNYLKMWFTMGTDIFLSVNGTTRYGLNLWNPELKFNASTLDGNIFKRVPTAWEQTIFVQIGNMALTYANAISALMNKGVPKSQIQGDVLWGAMRQSMFPGIANTPVMYDQNLDVVMPWGVYHFCMGNASTGCAGIPVVGSIFLQPFSAGAMGVYNLLGMPVRWGNGEVNLSTPATLTACQPGQYITTAKVGTTCKMCKAGFVTTAMDEKKCTACPAGKFSEPSGAICTNCAPGKGTSLIASTACGDCVPGFFSPGAQGCESCENGRFAQGFKNSNCTSCETVLAGSGSPRAAKRPEECVCRAGTYRQRGNGTCASCPKKMTCKDGSDMENFWAAKAAGFPASDKEIYPILEQQYWSSEDNPLSVFECTTIKSCPGGRPGSCGPNMEGQSCGKCNDGYFRTDDTCQQCSDIEVSPALFPAVPLTVAPIVIGFNYWAFRDMPEKWETWQNCLAGLVLLLLAAYQLISLVGTTNVNWPRTTRSTFTSWEWTNNLLSIFNTGCAGVRGFRLKYIFKSSTPVAGMFLVIWTYFLSRVAGYCGKKHVVMEIDRLVNVYMSLVYTFFAGIANFSMALFQFRDSPNGEKALTKDVSVLQSSSEWTSMLGLGIVAIMVECVGVMTLLCYVIKTAPAKFQTVGFQKRWKFLFIKYRPDVYWWGAPFALRGVIVNLGLILFVTGGKQLYWIFFAMTIYCTLTVRFTPWRVRVTNGFDVVCSLAVASVASLSTWFASRDNDMGDAVSYIVIGISFTCVASFAICAVILIVPRLSGTSTIERVSIRREEKKSLALQRIHVASKMMSALDNKTLESFWMGHLGEYDRSNILKACEVVLYEMRVIKSKRLTTGAWTDKGKRLSQGHFLKGKNSYSSNCADDEEMDLAAPENVLRIESTCENDGFFEERELVEENPGEASFQLKPHALEKPQDTSQELPREPTAQFGSSDPPEIEDVPYQISPSAAGWSCTIAPSRLPGRTRPSTPRKTGPGTPPWHTPRPPKATPRT